MGTSEGGHSKLSDDIVESTCDTWNGKSRHTVDIIIKKNFLMPKGGCKMLKRGANATPHPLLKKTEFILGQP